MDIIIITALVTAGVLFIFGGVGLWIFVDWLENNEEWFGIFVNWSYGL